MPEYKLTVRHGSSVQRLRFEELDGAIAAMRELAGEIRAGGPLEPVKAFREYEPAKRVAARIELSRGGWLRGSEAGLDVMGDGSYVAYAGAIRKRRLGVGGDGTVFEAIREELDG